VYSSKRKSSQNEALSETSVLLDKAGRPIHTDPLDKNPFLYVINLSCPTPARDNHRQAMLEKMSVADTNVLEITE
jgi:hypothetical protein